MDDRNDEEKIEIRKYRNILFGSLCFILLLFSIAFSVEIRNSYALGDIILNKIGLDPWSAGNGGFHNTILYSFAMFIVGYIGIAYFLQEDYPKFIRKLPLLLIIILFLMPSILSYLDGVQKGYSHGIDAIDYDRETSRCEYVLEDNGNVIFRANFLFHNYSDELVTFHIKYIPYEIFAEDTINETILIATYPDTDTPQEFMIPPKSSTIVSAYFKATSKTDLSNFSGSSWPSDIIIYTEDDEKSFIKLP